MEENKVCTSCGAAMEEDNNTCTSCGAVNEAASTEEESGLESGMPGTESLGGTEDAPNPEDNTGEENN